MVPDSWHGLLFHFLQTRINTKKSMKPKLISDFPVADFITNRWSPRAFSDKIIKESDILTLFEAARWSPSSRNSQPWRFIYSQNDNSEIYKKLFSCMVEWNQSWAHTAPMLVLGIAQTKFKKHINTHALYDLGLSVGQMTAQASSMGIYIHQMGGINIEDTIRTFNLSENYSPIVMLAIGYPGDISKIPADIAADEYLQQKRLQVKEFAFNSPVSLAD